MTFSFDGHCTISGVINGLVCIIRYKRLSNGRKETVLVLGNPSTGESLPLKKVKMRRATVSSMLGYDPIDKEFKVLSMTRGDTSIVEEEHKVLTLGTDKWRMVEYCPPGHNHDVDKELCINGVLYRQNMCLHAICCFDIRSEKLSFIKLDETIYHSTLINYSGKLGLLWSMSADGYFRQCFDHMSISLRLWVLEDVERHEWSKRIIALPPLWNYLVGRYTLDVVGVTGTNEIVFEAYDLHSYLFYLNTATNTIVRVEIQGIDCYDRFYIFMNHVEDVKLM